MTHTYPVDVKLLNVSSTHQSVTFVAPLPVILGTEKSLRRIACQVPKVLEGKGRLTGAVVAAVGVQHSES